MKKIFINPGHYIGVDPGAVGNGLEEARVAMNIANRVSKYLQAVGYVTKVFSYDGLAVICEDANSWGADLFVSIHCNAATGWARGTETYTTGSVWGTKLAKAIQNQILKHIPETVDRGVKIRGFYVIQYTSMPAVLIETAFIDNPIDAKLLVNREDDFARAIAVGITDYFSFNAQNLMMPDVVDLPTKTNSNTNTNTNTNANTKATVNANSTKLSEHFDISEFACHHCGKSTKISPRLIELLETLRKNIGGLPIHINSGYRCPVHNANVGGVPNSQHVLGTAADLAIPAKLTLNQFLKHVEKLPFDWVGVYPYSYFIHVDVRDGGIGAPVVDMME